MRFTKAVKVVFVVLFAVALGGSTASAQQGKPKEAPAKEMQTGMKKEHHHKGMKAKAAMEKKGAGKKMEKKEEAPPK